MKVSVVIPTYNEEKNIGKCLESLCNQTMKRS
ncbi:MAG: glycosyltransferase, partial [Methanomicrobiales archaeon]|nr:glycosyltransferase [Methanomicrobiales archaeon]